MSEWRYIASRLNGDGTETFLNYNIPLQNALITEELSGPGAVTGTIAPRIAALRDDDGLPVFKPWSTALYAENGSSIYGGGILVDVNEQGQELSLDTVGFTGYAKDQFYRGNMTDVEGIDVDPLDMFRLIFNHLQNQRDGNLGLILDDTKSPVRIGDPRTKTVIEKVKDKDGKMVDKEVKVDTGLEPYELAYFKTFDLGQEIDDLALTTPFEYRTAHRWTGDTMEHRVLLGYPRLGRRRHDLRFVVGENIYTIPPMDTLGANYASDVLLLGAGEGRKMVRSDVMTVDTGRLRRAIVVEDKNERNKDRANKKAQAEVNYRKGKADLSEVVIENHPNAALATYNVGDDIPIDTTGGWSDDQQFWSRIMRRTINPETGTVTLSVVSAEKVA